jgi:hypothetical protein
MSYSHKKESQFLRKIFPGFLLEKSAKKYTTANPFGWPDPASLASHPTRGVSHSFGMA